MRTSTNWSRSWEWNEAKKTICGDEPELNRTGQDMTEE
jgi:hypothetical protein